MFLEQKAHGFDVWQQPMVQLRLPMLFNLRSDPFERAQHEAGDYVRWFIEHAFVLVPAQGIVAQHLASFQQFPPRQRPGSFSVEQAMEKLQEPAVQQLAPRILDAAELHHPTASPSRNWTMTISQRGIDRRSARCSTAAVAGGLSAAGGERSADQSCPRLPAPHFRLPSTATRGR